MHVLLINPPRKVPGLQDMSPPVMPIGLAYVAAVLEKHGIEVNILDAYAEKMNYSQICDYLLRKQPDVIGITSYTATAPDALNLSRAIKESYHDCKIVFGGPHFTYFDQETLKNNPIDVIVRGEGEYSFLELIKALENNTSLESVDGITYKKNGQVIRNKERTLIDDLDELPYPARHLFDVDKYGFLIQTPKNDTICTSRGCTYRCKFCATPLFWRHKWRARSAGSVVKEMSYLKSKYNVKMISFLDDNFTKDFTRVEQICDLILKENLDVKWFFQSRVDSIVAMESILPKLRESGGFFAFLGIESGSQEILNNYGKALQIDQTVKAFELLRENDILSWASLVVGGPKDSQKTFKDNLKLLKKIDPDFVVFQVFAPLPGASAFREVADAGFIEIKDWEKYDHMRPVIRTEYLSRFQVRLHVDMSYATFYGKKFLKIGEYVFSDDELKRNISRVFVEMVLKCGIKTTSGRFM